MKTAIITGANGFIGSALVKELIQHDYRVYAVCRENSYANVPCDGNADIIVCDLEKINRLGDILPQDTYDFFFHLAWKDMGGPNRCNALQQLQNVQWSIEALRVSQKLHCKRFIGAGSMMERQMLANIYSCEGKAGNGDIYGAAKLSAHVMSKDLAKREGIEWVWPIIGNAYGPGQNGPWLVNTTLQKCFRGEPPQFTAGEQICDLIYIDDVVRAFRLIAENGNPFQTYYIGSSNAKPLKEFLLEMQKSIAPNLEFKFGDVPYNGAALPLEEFDCSRTEGDTGFRAQVGFSEGCKRTMAWLQAQENK